MQILPNPPNYKGLLVIHHTFGIKEIIVLLTDAMDYVMIKTDKSSPFSYFPNENLIFEFKVPKDTGASYVKDTFNFVPVVKSSRSD